jgi:hypothetical protein
MERLMKLTRIAPILTVAVLAAIAPASAGDRAEASSSEPCAADALRRRSDPSLDALRAGQVDEGRRVSTEERAALASAQASSPELLDLRAGGAVEVLLIVLLVVVILLLI